jgi:DNA-binding transcriptional regulator LsrR (DeoR family)
MAKESIKFDYERLKKRDLALYRQLLYEVTRLFVEEGLNYNQIPDKIYTWAEDKASQYYNDHGKKNISRQWVSRHIKEVSKEEYQFLLLGEFRENMLSQKIKEHIDNAGFVSLKIAPDNKLLLRQVCLDFDKILTEKVKSTSADEEVIVGVSGGHTMLALAQTLHDIKTIMSWHKIVPNKDKKKVIICSLTTGGTRDNISALSDTTAANISQELEAQARGLLGPPSFKDKSARDVFVDDEDVQKHIGLVKKADIILTSVGNVHDDASLTSQIFRIIDPQHLDKIRKKYKHHLGDILYQCYNGYNGNIVTPSKEIADRIFSVIALLELRRKVQGGQTKCIVVADGYEKGYRALRGVIMKRMASDIYMDLKCAQGLSDIAEGK